MPVSKSVDEKLWYIYTMEYQSAMKKKELLPFATAWVELESVMISEIRHGTKDKYYMISTITGT